MGPPDSFEMVIWYTVLVEPPDAARAAGSGNLRSAAQVLDVT